MSHHFMLCLKIPSYTIPLILKVLYLWYFLVVYVILLACLLI